jgi:Protein of unknown function (DUF1641)
MAMSVDGTLAATPQERLQERLADPRTVEAIHRLLDRLDVISFTAEALEGFLARAEVVSDSVAQGLAEMRQMAGENGSGEILARLPQLLRAGARLAEVIERPEVQALASSGLLETLSDPRTVTALKALLDKAEMATFLLDALDGFLRRADTMADSLAAGAADLRQALPGVDTGQLSRMAEALPGLVDAGQLLANAGMFDPKTVDALARFGRSVAGARDEMESRPQPALGVFGLLRALRDSEIQPVLQFVLLVARRFGRDMKQS